MSIRIAKASPFSGVPIILAPSIIGATLNKYFFFRIPAIGERPMKFSVSGLPDGLEFNGRILAGCIRQTGEWSINLNVSNKLGTSSKTVLLSCAPDNALLTPLLGFSTWNAFACDVTQQDIKRTSHQMIDMGIADYGYNYINLDSGWQKEYGGKFDAIQPNEKFPDMKGMYDDLHALGLHGGIYSTPMLTAWGCPPELPFLPGCTRGEPDILFTNMNGGIGTEHLEDNNVRQWDEWGVDYLKYDWLPTDPINADPMKKALLNAVRDIPMCVTVRADVNYGNYWTKNCSSWRNNHDSLDKWDIFEMILKSTEDPWENYIRPGHFFDLDMLEIGEMFWNEGKRGLTDAEELSCYSLRAFFASPIQLSCKLENLTDFEFDLICNEEIIAVNQDALAAWPRTIKKDDEVHIYERPLENGDIAYAVFNLKSEQCTVKLNLPENSVVRDLWRKENLTASTAIEYCLPPHGACILRATPV